MEDNFYKTLSPFFYFRDDSRGVIHKHNFIPIYPNDSKDNLRKLWLNEKEMLKVFVPLLESVNSPYPTDIFFYNIIPVPPPIVRPISKLNDQFTEHPRTIAYKLIIQNSLILRKIIAEINDSQNEIDDLSDNEENGHPERNSKNKDKEKSEEIQVISFIKF